MLEKLSIELAIAGVSSFLLTVILSRCIIPILVAKKAGQPIRAEGPKSHYSKAGTPTMGGISFILAISIVLAIFSVVYAVYSRQSELIPVALTMILAMLNGMIGFFDDYKKLAKKQNEGLSMLQKSMLQTLVAIIYVALLAFTGNIDTMLKIPFMPQVVELGWVYYIFAVVLIVGVVNSVNLTDGIDGLASSVTLVISIFFGVVALTALNSGLCVLAGVLAGGAFGFLVYNHYPARVFMGDTGSLFLGGAVTGMAFMIDQPMIIMIAGGIYILEAVSVMLQIFSFKVFHRRIFKCSPIHHHFEQCGWSEVKIVTVFSLITVALCVLAWFGI